MSRLHFTICMHVPSVSGRGRLRLGGFSIIRFSPNRGQKCADNLPQRFVPAVVSCQPGAFQRPLASLLTSPLFEYILCILQLDPSDTELDADSTDPDLIHRSARPRVRERRLIPATRPFPCSFGMSEF
jgi:hypothetical protein